MSKNQLNTRYEILDFIRGIAIALMFIYHLSFGFAQLGLIKINLTDGLFWVSFRTLIVFLFLTLVGIGLVIATRKQLNIRSYVKRLLLLLIYASLITGFSYYVRPDYYVFFGILHLILISSLLGLLFTRFYWINLFIALLFIAAGHTLEFSSLNQPEWLWLGMNSESFRADDYAPLFPWFGFVLFGLFLGRFLFEKNQFNMINDWQSKYWMTKLVSFAGRYSIHLYFVHFQFFYLLVYLFG